MAYNQYGEWEGPPLVVQDRRVSQEEHQATAHVKSGGHGCRVNVMHHAPIEANAFHCPAPFSALPCMHSSLSSFFLHRENIPHCPRHIQLLAMSETD